MLRSLAISRIETNNGQIPGLPRNPRLIRDHRFEKLKKSIAEFPDMVKKYRPVIVFPLDKKFIAVAGNMRFLACKDLGWNDLPVLVLSAETSADRLRELAVKDNIPFGEDDIDIIANEWTDFPLEEWGLELPAFEEFQPELMPEVSNRKISAEDIVKTKSELEDHYKEPHKYVEVICPHCLETFFLNPE